MRVYTMRSQWTPPSQSTEDSLLKRKASTEDHQTIEITRIADLFVWS